MPHPPNGNNQPAFGVSFPSNLRTYTNSELDRLFDYVEPSLRTVQPPAVGAETPDIASCAATRHTTLDGVACRCGRRWPCEVSEVAEIARLLRMRLHGTSKLLESALALIALLGTGAKVSTDHAADCTTMRVTIDRRVLPLVRQEQAEFFIREFANVLREALRASQP